MNFSDTDPLAGRLIAEVGYKPTMKLVLLQQTCAISQKLKFLANLIDLYKFFTIVLLVPAFSAVIAIFKQEFSKSEEGLSVALGCRKI
jgi:hypothetical protein